MFDTLKVSLFIMTNIDLKSINLGLSIGWIPNKYDNSLPTLSLFSQHKLSHSPGYKPGSLDPQIGMVPIELSLPVGYS